MEDIMDLPSQQRPQSDHHRGNDLCYFKWSVSSRSQLLEMVLESQVVSF
jgi:hypothetical protein